VVQVIGPTEALVLDYGCDEVWIYFSPPGPWGSIALDSETTAALTLCALGFKRTGVNSSRWFK